MIDMLINLVLAGLFLNTSQTNQLTLAHIQEPNLAVEQVQDLQTTAPQPNPASDSVGVKVTAQSVLVVDNEFNKILYQKNSDQVRSIASLTKLMTALVFLDHNPGWKETIKMQSSDQRAGGIVYLVSGEEFSVYDVFHTMLIASSNEAAVALARSTGLTQEEFITAMNNKAKELGMENTVFADTTGLSQLNQSTAVDVMLMLQTALDQTEILNATTMKAFQVDILNSGRTRKIKSTNLILDREFGVEDQVYEVLAGKTGYLEVAGYCLATLIGNNQGNEILTVVLGSQSLEDRFNDTKSIAYWVFNNYIWQQ